MAAETATIRVTRETRDLLAEQASERGTSISALLADVARGMLRDAIFHAEREASRVDALNPAVRDEERAWDSAVADGLG
jgi:uncharacterized protein (DUF1778 family)